MKDIPRNALAYGRYYFEKSRLDPSPYSSGRSLGLSLHYLEDLCMPMHCGLYPNIPAELGWTFRAALLAFIPMLPFGVTLGATLAALASRIVREGQDWRHERYELWALAVQNDCRLDAAQLALGEFSGWSPDRYWQRAAESGLAIYKKWDNNSTSPISDAAPYNEPDHTQPLRREDGRTEWLRDLQEMLHLAQRLVAGLLFVWAENSVLAWDKRSGRSLPYGGDGGASFDDSLGINAWGAA
jgi:hypothetical protein